ncbi:hypothetical protein VN12_16265 [Pirellula sp. SH-Sr6A]|uniref:hypothetical protein n=1 Tax=Pirellula sp. SH-Sr6A TaxID=1632865 RepID=UPI00078D82F3|nr:hypothetical protein [Pirellula sp. SH-Sr6A]AMV33684.1 hypothetical protein VN12_16265 [Pirellula sp. SH-Sr6A]
MNLKSSCCNARHAPQFGRDPSQEWLKSSLFLAVCLSVTCLAQSSLAQQSPSKSGDKPPRSANRANEAKKAANADQEVRKPASVEEAAQVIDLSTFPLLPNVLAIHARSVGHLEYVVSLKSFDVKSEYEFQRRNLLARQWQELPDGDGQFTRSGFHLYVTVQTHDEPGKAVVKLQNHGNVNVSKLPVPKGTKYIKTAYNVADFETAASVQEARDMVLALLMDQGWQPYGMRGDAMDMKQNAVLLTASITSTRKPGVTRIAFWTTQMPVELPVPPQSESILYQSDRNRLELVAVGSMDEIATFYKNSLAAFDWQPIAEKPVREINSQQFVLTFRNRAQDMVRLGMSERGKEKTRITLEYQSKGELDARSREP